MAKTFIKCKNCGHEEELTRGALRKFITGSAGAIMGGKAAYASYLFAGSGIASPLCIAIDVGGVCLALLPGLRNLLARIKPCPECGFKDWEVYTVDGKSKKYRTTQKL
ncbi:hypothetical protein [uncultured Parasutterella sp.]|uniref:hypothetical protein n=1 Tax=uncultured Parasutterella sp. TaxID=1263098 RepID=UPI0025D1D3C9|nr:hypothetical protein [uncultured Parasutterella sp.]